MVARIWNKVIRKYLAVPKQHEVSTELGLLNDFFVCTGHPS
jgi:hypothetical protein